VDNIIGWLLSNPEIVVTGLVVLILVLLVLDRGLKR
jgi:hypothetical protein